MHWWTISGCRTLLFLAWNLDTLMMDLLISFGESSALPMTHLRSEPANYRKHDSYVQ